MARINKLFLFVHLMMPPDPIECQTYLRRWHDLIHTEGPSPENALCVLSISPNGLPELHAAAAEQFGSRCVFDPSDDSDSTKILQYEDLAQMLRVRGRFAQWTPYEMWTSVMARRWTQGLKLALENRNLDFDPATLRVVSCGQQWAGCLTKYSMLITRYLGVTQPPHVLVDLCQDAGWPLVNARFIEHIAMNRHVSLFLFKTADGRPMGQFLDGLRATWEPPHVAIVDADASRFEITMITPNEAVPVGHVQTPMPGCTVAQVGDGCRPQLSTLVGKNDSFGKFKKLLAHAHIEPTTV